MRPPVRAALYRDGRAEQRVRPLLRRPRPRPYARSLVAPWRWIEVDSSAVEAVGYDPGERAIHVRFREGGTYRYDDADQRTFDALRAADSVGAYVNRVLKPNHAYTRL